MAKKTFWQNRIKSNRKESKKESSWNWGKLFKIILVAAVALGVFLGVKQVISIYREYKEFEFSHELSKEFEDKQVQQDNNTYNNSDTFSILVLQDWEGGKRSKLNAVSIIQIDKNEPEARVISIHPDLHFKPYEYGNKLRSRHDGDLVRIADLMVIGDLQSSPIPLYYPYYQIEELMALDFDGYLYIDNVNINLITEVSGKHLPRQELEQSDGFEVWAEIVNNYWISVFSEIKLIRVIQNRQQLHMLETNMTLNEWYGFIRDFKEIESDNKRSITISEDYLLTTVDEKGDTVNLVTQAAIDETLLDFVGDSKVDREQARMEIFNGSGINGLGGRYGRWVKHLGIDVIRIGTAPGKQEKTVVYTTDKEEFKYTLEKLKGLWDGEVEIKEGRPEFMTTGDIILVIGMDF
jgi:hypothetical protein